MIRLAETARRPIATFILSLAVLNLQLVAAWADEELRADDGIAAITEAPDPAQQTGFEVTVSKSADPPLPDGALLRLGSLRFQHPSSVFDMALSPDERHVVTVDDELLLVWDAQTGQERWRARGTNHRFTHSGAAYGVRTIVFSADSQSFVTPGRNGEVVWWDVVTGQHQALSIALPRPVRIGSIDLSPNGHQLALGSANGVVVCDRSGQVLYEVANDSSGKLPGNDRLTFLGHYSIAWFSPDGKLLAVVTSGAPDVIRLCDCENGRELRQIPLTSRLVRLAFAPDAGRIATTERDSAVRLYDVRTAQEVWSHIVKLTDPHENYTSAIAFSPDGKSIAAGATDHNLYLFDAVTGKKVASLAGHHWYPWAVAFTADSQVLFSSGWDGRVRRWDLATGQQLPLPEGVPGSAAVAISPDGQMLAFVDDQGTIRLVADDDGADRLHLPSDGARYSCLTFSSDGRQLAAGGTQGNRIRVGIWDATNGKWSHRWDWLKGQDPNSDVEELHFSPDGRQLAAVVFRQSTAYLWDLRTDQQIAALRHPNCYGLSFSPDGRTLATAGWDSTIRFWNTAAGIVQGEHKVEPDPMRGNDTRIYTVCYAPQGGLIATAHLDGDVRVWRAHDMSLLTEFEVDGRFIYGAMTFSADGLWLATGGMNGNVALWDPLTGQKVWDRGEHDGYVYTVSFSHTGRTLISGGDDGIGYLWSLKPQSEQSAKHVGQLWEDLAGGDGAAAYQAMWTLAATPELAVRLLAEIVQPVEDVSGQEEIRALITKLASSDNSVRQSAQEELVTLGTEAIPQLRRAIARAGAAEDARDVRNVLVELELSSKAVAQRRAVSTLAQIGTPAATDLLRQWANRDDESILSQSAAAALEGNE